MKQTLRDSLYAKTEKVYPAYSFLQSIMRDSTVYLFGGGVRDYLDGTLDFSRDLDFVIESKTIELDITKYINGCKEYRRNRFGGYKVFFSNDLVFDIWDIEETWAFKTNRLPVSSENLMNSVYLNIDRLVYSVTTDTYLGNCDKLYSIIKKERLLDIFYSETPCEELNLLRALVYKKKYNMHFSKKLKTKLYEYYATRGREIVQMMLDVEMDHYNSTILSGKEILYELDALKEELSLSIE